MAVIVLESRPSRHPALLDDRHFPVADLSSGMVAGAERAAKANLQVTNKKSEALFLCTSPV
jgi:hypothetical protein